MNEPAVTACDLHKSYHLGKTTLHVLRGVSFSVKKGEFLAIVGASGSGKSTLLHMVGLLDRPDSGHVELAGRDTRKMSRAKVNAVRCSEVGFIFQFYHLLGELNVLENVLLPARIASSSLRWLGHRGPARKQAMALLEELGLGDRIKHTPSELSGGERQRVAIARALMNAPAVLLADEPTGNLDSKTGKRILDVLKRFNEKGQTILMVTHDTSLAAQTHRTIHLRDGRLE
jgi:ABC-type lipoprotein export system ATPase subunit